jgi:hypothetical protein
MFRDEYIVQISEYLLARCSKDSLIQNNAPKLQLYPSLQYHTSILPFSNVYELFIFPFF